MARATKRRVDDAVCGSDTVVFNVGGRYFEVFRHTIQSRPSTLLANLLDDISFVDDSTPIFVDANPDRFAHVLDWYRYGEMYVAGDCAVGAVLRDARYFMLSDMVKINGEIHRVGHPTAQEVRNATRAALVAEWPNFEQYVRDTVEDLTAHLERLGQEAKDSISTPEFWSRGSEPTYVYKDFPLASYRSDRQQWVWHDEQNVCNPYRLRILLAELRSRGFDCSVEAPPPHNQSYPYAQPAHKFDGAVAKMRIGVHLEVKPQNTGLPRVALDGVHVAHGRLWVSR